MSVPTDKDIARLWAVVILMEVWLFIQSCSISADRRALQSLRSDVSELQVRVERAGVQP